MRIALFTETFLPKIDGISNRLRYTVEELVAAGHEIRVFGPADSVEEHAGVKVVRIPGLPALSRAARRAPGSPHRLGAVPLQPRGGARGLSDLPGRLGPDRCAGASHPDHRLLPHRLSALRAGKDFDA